MSLLVGTPAGWGPAKIARRVGFTLFGVPGTEANPDFIEQVGVRRTWWEGNVGGWPREVPRGFRCA